MYVCIILTACKEAYTDSESEGACAFGCQGQLPAIETRRRQVIYSIVKSCLSRSHFLILMLIDFYVLKVSTAVCFKTMNVKESGIAAAVNSVTEQLCCSQPPKPF